MDISNESSVENIDEYIFQNLHFCSIMKYVGILHFVVSHDAFLKVYYDLCCLVVLRLCLDVNHTLLHLRLSTLHKRKKCV